MADKIGIDLKIVKLLLTEGEDVSIREMARQLGISSSLTHYHMKRLASLGVLMRREMRDGGGYYVLQDLFTENVKSSIDLLHTLRGKVNDGSDEKLAECLRYFLKCQKIL